MLCLTAEKFGLGLSKKITSYKDINELYEQHFEVRDFTHFEMKIFNSDDEVTVNLNDKEHIYSLSNYYYLIKDKVNFLKYTTILMKMEDPRGIFKLGVHFQSEKDYENAKKYYNMASAKGHVISKFNLSGIYKIEGNIELAKQFLQECISLNFKPAYSQLAATLFLYDRDTKGTVSILIDGMEKECTKCLEVFESFFENSTILYIKLIRLSFTNLMIQNKIREILPRVDLDEVEECRGCEIVYVLPPDLS